MSGSVSLSPSLSAKNILANPVSTILGITAAVQGVVGSLPGGTFPTSAVGWLQLVFSLGLGVFGMLSK
jgi:hypothetical protein